MPAAERSFNTQRAIRILFISWLVSGTTGTTFILCFWNSRSMRETGMFRAAMYVACLTIVHLVGFVLYRRQYAPAKPMGHSYREILFQLRATDLSSLRNKLHRSHFFMLFLASLLLDGGAVHVYLIRAVVGYWVGAGLIICRRRKNPTRFDLQFLSLGTLLTIEIDFIPWVVVNAMRWRGLVQ